MKTKRCNRCGLTKELYNFHKNKSAYDGLQGYCKPCCTVIRLAYDRTIPGLLSKIYSNQNTRVNKGKVDGVYYSKAELFDWIISQSNFDKIHNDWINSNYDKKLTPSVDRLDDYKGYSLDNIRLVAWDVNRKRGYLDQINGINNKQATSVVKLSLNMKFIKEYYSLRSASRANSLSVTDIANCCKNKHGHLTSGNFIWKYKKDYENER